MRTLAAVLAALALAGCGGSSAATSTRVEFGTSGGNIQPQTYVISVNGDLQQQLQGVLGSGPTDRRCPGTLPDVASDYIRAGGRTVTVHGSCDAAFTRLWKKLYSLRGASSG